MTTDGDSFFWLLIMNIPLHDDLNSKQMRRVIYSLALPIVGTHLLLRGVGIVDTAMVGHISAEAQAAVGMAQWILNMLMALLQAINVGGTVLVAKYTGAGDVENRKAVADTAFWTGIVSAVIMALAGIVVVRPIAAAMGADSALSNTVYSYLMILCFFFVSRATIIIVSGIFQGYGDTKTPFRVIVGVNAVHFLIAFPLTFGYLGFPRLEIEGVALATGISETMGAILLTYLAARKNLLCFKCLSLKTLKNIFLLGFPVFIERLATTIMQMTYTRLVLLTSVAAFAAHSVGMMIEAVAFLPGFGFAQAATTLVGQNLGAKRPGKAREYSSQALYIALAFMGFLGLTYWFFPDLWMRLFSSDPEVIDYGILFCKFAAVLQIPLAFSMILSGSLRGAGQTRWVMYTSLIGAWVVRIPVAYILHEYFGLGIFFIWLAMPLDWAARAILMFIKFSSHKWSDKTD